MGDDKKSKELSCLYYFSIFLSNQKHASLLPIVSRHRHGPACVYLF